MRNNDKLKIAMIGHKRIPSREGGVEIVVEELSTRMAALGHEVVAYNRKGKNVADATADLELHNLKEYKGVKLIKVATSERKSLNALLYSFNATVMAIFKHYDVIHYHAEGPCAMILLAHIFGKRTVATIHGLDWQRSKWGGFATKYLKFGEKMAAKYADEVIVLSENVKQYFKDTYNRDVKFIPNGVSEPLKHEPEIIKEKYGLDKDDYFLYLARIVPEKGLHYMLEAFSRVDTDRKFVIAGGSSHTGDYVEQIKELASKDSRVIMTGFVQGQELQELFSNAYTYVLPSDVEGMPLSLLEAMSYGNCCLTSDIPECIEVVGDYAVSFIKSDVDDLTAKVTKLCNEPETVKKYQQEAKSYILNRYSWDDIVKETVELYKLYLR